MNKITLVVCENLKLEYARAVELNGFNDVLVISYPSVCENTESNKNELNNWLDKNNLESDSTIFICESYCNILKHIPDYLKNATIIRIEKCFSNLAGINFINEWISNGGYIITAGWLMNWQEHIQNMGFDRETAIRFYKEFAKTLVFLDSGFYSESPQKIKELSEYLELPFISIQIEIDYLKMFLKSIIYEWKLHNLIIESQAQNDKWKKQVAEYASIFNIVSKLSSLIREEDVIKNLTDTFVILFSAGKCIYWNIATADYTALPEYIKTILNDKEKKYTYSKSKDNFILPIEFQDEIIGIIEVGSFSFPQYAKHYLNFALNIVNVCGLAISNARKYEKIVISEKSYKYLSMHDTLTGLYNREYFEEKLKEFNNRQEFAPLTIFVFDVDKLKFVNDNFGHKHGDKLIQKTSEILKLCFRDYDIITRIGGDEFCVIIPNCNSKRAALIKKRFDKLILNVNKKAPELELSISIGIATSNVMNIEKIFNDADKKMYLDKSKKDPKIYKRTS